MNTDQTRSQLADLIDDGSSPEAADLTASQILAENVVIPRADLPEVVDCGDGWINVGSGRFSSAVNAIHTRMLALRYLAIAEHLDAREAREAEAAKEAELTKRRDALANEMYRQAYGPTGPVNYAHLGPCLRACVDRIREAEDKLAKYEAQA